MAKGYVVEGSQPLISHTSTREGNRYEASGNRFTLTLATGPVEDWSTAKSSVKDFWGWGAATENSDRLRTSPHVRELNITLDGKRVSIPEACYIDLIDLRIGLEQQPVWSDDPRYLLYLEGADAGESYRVKFTIANHQVIRREIWAGEFPEMGATVTNFE